MISVYMYRKLNIKVYRNILIYIMDFCLILWLRSSVCLCGSDQQLKEIIQEYVMKVKDLPQMVLVRQKTKRLQIEEAIETHV